ncbi:uncharacterized protein LOC125884304 [Epinephelus fuscoguttatus]|uniref:uncharacterized protein LOC125884304 n=1 Tax=Epinephelus fuscoguttatus TaxID=293821 RepID=UPI0020D09EC9|nr:uncharacterized protein LOC125884304 [Epinephelus fuscoguttatus]
MPRYTLSVKGVELSFLVDSGAAESVVRRCEFPPEVTPKLSGRYQKTIGVAGVAIVEKYTAPLTCFDSDMGKSFKHSFLYSDKCPVNLMGRDLMCRLGIVLICTPEGVQVKRVNDLRENCAFFKHAEGQFMCEWKVNLPPSVLLQFPETHTHADVTCLHCTAHMASVSHADCDNENAFCDSEQERDRLQLDCLYWNDVNCAILVKLPNRWRELNLAQNSDPHISLVNPSDTDLGLWVRELNASPCWRTSTDPHIDFNDAMGVHRKKLGCVIEISRSLTVTDKTVSEADWCMVKSVADIPELQQVPAHLWAQSKYDVGLIKNCEPVIITPKSDYRPCRNQYPLRREAVEGIKPVFDALLKAGVIVPCPNSPVRTPIFPVRKIRPDGEPAEWRFVQDLQAVNAAVQARVPMVPNPHTILSQVPADSKWFSVVDLSNAFFSVPVHLDSQFWFAFCFEGKMWTFSRLCQGFSKSPTIYNSALHDSLETLVLPESSALLQYVDDLLVASATREGCVKDTIALLTHLAEQGHKASLSKLQFVSQEVTFLGHVISPEGKTLTPKRIEDIQKIPKPQTKKQLMSFLGMTSYCRQWVPNYAEIEAPLAAIAHGKGLKASDHVIWTPEAEKSFVDLKLSLQTPPTLGLPDCTRPFTQTVDEKGGYMTSVLLQAHGGRQRPVAYFSSKLDSVAAGLPHCLRAVAAAERAVVASRDIVGYADLTLLVPHAVSLILLEQKTSHLSAARWLRYNAVLLELPNIKVKAALPKPAEGKLHNLNPGDYVVVRDLRRKNWKARRWNGPFQVLLVTETAVKVAERATWIHASHCRRVPDPRAHRNDDRDTKAVASL